MAPRKKKASRPAVDTQLRGAVDTLRHARTGHDGGGDEQPTRDKAKDTRRGEALIYGCPIVDTGGKGDAAVPPEEASAPAPTREEQHRSSRNTRCRGERQPRQVTSLTVTDDRSLRRYTVTSR
ncbi:unnamed protein product [Ixodes pacificus]